MKKEFENFEESVRNIEKQIAFLKECEEEKEKIKSALQKSLDDGTFEQNKEKFSIIMEQNIKKFEDCLKSLKRIQNRISED